MTKPDNKHCSVLGRKQSRLDATLGYQNVAYDMERCTLKFATRSIWHAFLTLYMQIAL